MDIRQADPDLESIARRLLHQEIDLQPDFQRQEVWSKVKKQKLIDTILRGWAIPPIHLVQSNEIEEVLDGQQRLTAIRDFFSGKFSVNGSIPPESDAVQLLDGLYYDDLPKRVRRKFDRYTLRIYTIFGADPQETAELFYRLNQPTALTSGEQRNALYGVRRTQMKSIVSLMIEDGFSLQTIGFSNARLSYDDVIARALVILEKRTLREKIGETEISNAFRGEQPFSEKIFESMVCATKTLSGSFKNRPLKLNKASLFSFLISFARFGEGDVDLISRVIDFLSKNDDGKVKEVIAPIVYRGIFLDRASSRVTDVSSVVLRDFCIARCLSAIAGVEAYRPHDKIVLHLAKEMEEQFDDWDDEEIVAKGVVNSTWGITI